jgi:hypothetical protein
MAVKDRPDLLARLNLGASVAENDEHLASYFVPTLALSDFLEDRYDIVRGAKGSGKSAILKIVSEQQSKYGEIADVSLVVATEHTGEPSFKRAFDQVKHEEVDEQELVNAWKIYFINLALDALERYPDTDASRYVKGLAEKVNVRYRTTSSLKKIWWSLVRILHVKSFTVGVDTISAEFPDAPPEFWTKKDQPIDFPELLRGCEAAFDAEGKRCWLLIDRLDAAFLDPEVERVALRALLMAYKDFMGHRRLRPKLFFRTDLLDLVVRGAGFRELTHVTDRTSPAIAWDPDKLLHMIMERFAFNDGILRELNLTKDAFADPELRQLAFLTLFPWQVDVGPRKPDTWNWMCSRIRDGNNTRTPRDLHGLVKHAVAAQRELLALGGDDSNEPLITAPALKKGLQELSDEKVRTTLLAENEDLAGAINAFRKQKAEQNSESLAKLLGKVWEPLVERLVRIGFLEKTGETWKVPMLYRDGLEITQGAAFEKNAPVDE